MNPQPRIAAALIALSLLSLVGCGGEPSNNTDAGRDSGTIIPTVDAGADAGEEPDAGVEDAGTDLDVDIRSIQDGTIATDTVVTVAEVVVTARFDSSTSTVLFLQEPTGAPEYSGVMVFINTSTPPTYTLPEVGDLVTVDGTVAEFARANQPGSRTNIEQVTNISIVGAGSVPAATVVPEPALVFGTDTAEKWEGVLVKVENATVQSRDSFGEFTLTGGLKADDRLYAYTQPWPGDTFSAIVGVMDHDFGTSRILPRDANDLIGYVAAAPVLTDLQPATMSVATGTVVTYTLGLDRPAPAAGTAVTVSSSDAAVGTVTSPTVTVAAGETSAAFDVTAVAPGTSDITAELNGVTKTSALTVVAGAATITAFGPSSLDVVSGGGTGMLELTLSVAAPAGGAPVALQSSAPLSVAVPATVTIPAGQTSARFRVRGDATTATSSTITATLGTSTATATVNVVTTAAAPGVGDLLINEINYDVPTANGDANCDGVTNATTDEFIELANISAHPVQLQDVSIWDATVWSAATPAPRFTFPAVVLGPGEAVVVFGGAPGTSATSPWCTNLDGTHIGDALVLGVTATTQGFGLNNGGDTVYVTSGTAKTTTELVTAEVLPSGTDEAVVRSPDYATTPMVKHTAAPGAATDRHWTPGTRIDGQPFSLANP